MILRTSSLLLLAALASFSLVPGCSSDAVEEDSAGAYATARTDYEISFNNYNEIYGSDFTTAEQAYSVNVRVGDKTIAAPTHLFGKRINVIPYSNEDNVATADGPRLKRGDEVIATVYEPGDVGIAVKHHRSEFPTLDLNVADASRMKEHFKLQDTHIEVVVGVQREVDGKTEPGAITLNNPQSYEDGLFGDQQYAMIFLKPVYPRYLSRDQKTAFRNNVRTLLVGFNAVTSFPNDYNGGDPLGARNPERVREYVKQMVLAINGHNDARAWFEMPENMVYCAELAFLSFSAGLIAPLNDDTMIPLVGEQEWQTFQNEMTKHNKGERSAFTDLNANKRVQHIKDLTVAPSDLKPAAAYDSTGKDKEKLALQPLTSADIIDDFLRTHLPRQILGEGLAEAQAKVLEGMKPGLLDQMKIGEAAIDPRRPVIDGVFAEIVKVVGTKHASYKAFRAALDPALRKARQISGPRGDSGEGLFVPPSLFHVAAQGRKAGLLKFQYAGHGVHVSAVKKRASARSEPTPVGDIAAEVSCKGQCGGMAAGGCFCDARCATDPTACCSDVSTVCTGN